MSADRLLPLRWDPPTAAIVMQCLGDFTMLEVASKPYMRWLWSDQTHRIELSYQRSSSEEAEAEAEAEQEDPEEHSSSEEPLAPDS